jgi:peptide-methionine (R)-S-oxide reductase
MSMDKIAKTEDQWREELSPDQYAVLRRQATEPPFAGKYVDTKEPGVYKCAGCQAELFRSDDKFDSGSGWPSFTDPALTDAVELRQDTSHGMVRTEAVCAKCGGHLGHVFDDGPRDRGGMRYCINSCALELDAGETPAA